ALYDPWEVLFAEVSQYRWKDSDRAGTDGAPRTEEQNLVSNEKIKHRIIQALYSIGSLTDLLSIAVSLTESTYTRELAELGGMRLLLRLRRYDEVKQRLKGSNFSALTRSDLNALVVSLAEA